MGDWNPGQPPRDPRLADPRLADPSRKTPPRRSGLLSRRHHSSDDDATPPTSNPYRAYRPYDGGASRGYPQPQYGERLLAAPNGAPAFSSWNSPVHARQHGFSIFHDGNAGHIWRADVLSLLGESIFGIGMLMWLAWFSGTVMAVACGAVMLGLPRLLAGPLAAPLQHMQDPGRALKWIGRLRAVAALGLVAMHYHTIMPVVYLLLFAIALLGQFRRAGRIAVERSCVAPGELERIANDLQIGGALAAVIGPLLAMVLFVALGERILLIGIGAAIFFLLTANSDGFLDPLPPARRAFLLAQPEASDVAALGDVASASTPGTATSAGQAVQDDSDTRREQLLPEWYSEGPSSVGQGFSEVGAGIGMAGASSSSAQAMGALALLAFVGGGLTVLVLFYLRDWLLVPVFYVGIWVAIEAAGTILASVLASQLAARFGRMLLPVAVAATGLSVAVMGLTHIWLHALVFALLLGVTSGTAIVCARQRLYRGFAGAQRRAIAVAEDFLTAFCGVAGALCIGILYVGLPQLPVASSLTSRVGDWAISPLLIGIGVLTAVGGVLRTVPRPELKPVEHPKVGVQGTQTGLAAQGEGALSGLFAAADASWEDDADADDDVRPRGGDRWGRSYRSEYEDEYQDAYEGSEYEPPRRSSLHDYGDKNSSNRGDRRPYDEGPDVEEYPSNGGYGYDEDPDYPPRRGGRTPRW